MTVTPILGYDPDGQLDVARLLTGYYAGGVPAPPRRGRRGRDWSMIDAALTTLPEPLPYGALTALAAELGLEVQTLYRRLHHQRQMTGTRSRDPAARPTPATPSRPPVSRPTPTRRPASAASTADGPGATVAADGTGSGGAAAAPVPNPTACPAPGCDGARTILADPRHMPTLPVPPPLAALAGNLGVCDSTSPHYSWVGAAGAEVLDLGAGVPS